MSFGYMGQILDVDLSSGVVTVKPLDDEVKLYIGGKGYCERLLYDLVPQGADPLGPENVLIFGTGPYNGTFGVQSTRFAVAFKSPLTGFMGNGTAGGDFAYMLKRAGYDFLIIRGKAPAPVFLEVTEAGAAIKDASHLWGLSTTETQKKFPKTQRCAVIGPAGENQVLYAAIVSGDRVAGRGGMGAVMGSKMLKAVVASGKQKVQIAEPEKFKHLNTWMADYYKNHSVTGRLLPSLGTANLLMTTNGRNIMPTYNFKQGHHNLAWKISGERMRDEFLTSQTGCTSCPIRCGRMVKKPHGAEGDKPVKGPEYETLSQMGSNLGVFDMEAVLHFNELADELGMDSISLGGTLSWAMEAQERGIFKSGLKFGDIAAIEKAVEDTAYRRGVGAELAEGSMRLSKKYGGEDFAIHVKGMEMAGYDPRGCYGQGLEYATATRGGDHINGATMAFEATGALSIDPLSVKAKPEFVIFQQNLIAVINAMITCTFSAYAIIPSVAGELNPQGFAYRSISTVLENSGPLMQVVLKLKPFMPVLWYERYLAYVTGEKYTLGRITETGERIFNLERLFNVREGVTGADDTLPGRLLNEPLFEGQKAGVPLDKMLPRYYKTRGWDETGIPREKTLDRLQIRR